MMLFVMLYAPCVTTIAVIRRETGTWKWPLFATVYATTIALSSQPPSSRADACWESGEGTETDHEPYTTHSPEVAAKEAPCAAFWSVGSVLVAYSGGVDCHTWPTWPMRRSGTARCWSSPTRRASRARSWRRRGALAAARGWQLDVIQTPSLTWRTTGATVSVR
jgi:hypothetical protein